MAINKMIIQDDKGNSYYPQTSSDVVFNGDGKPIIADYIRMPGYATATGSANTYAVTLNPAPTSYTDGMCIVVKINVASTGTSTLNVNNLGAKTILDSLGKAITAGGLKAGLPYALRYNGTNFIVQGKGGGGNATAGDLLSGKTATVDTGQITGTIPSKSEQTYTPGTNNQTIAAGQYLSGTQTILGDTDLIAVNIKAGANIFGVAGKPTVVDTEDATGVAADVRAGKTVYIEGNKVTGTKPVQATSGQIVTPGTSNIVKKAGIYDGDITIKGESNLKPENIKEGVSEFGIIGTLKEKQDIFNYLLNIPSGTSYNKLTPIGFVEGEGMWFMQGTDSNGTAILLNSSGTVTKTLAIGGNGMFFHASKDYIMRQTYPDKNIEITNKSGTVITTIPTTYYGTGLFGCINQYNNQIYFTHAATCDIYNLSGTLLYSVTVPNISTGYSANLLIPCKGGAILLFDNGENTSISTISTVGTVTTRTLTKTDSKENKVYGVLLNALI